MQELEKYKKGKNQNNDHTLIFVNCFHIQELEKTNEEMELLRQKYQVAKDDFDNINTEYQKLLVILLEFTQSLHFTDFLFDRNVHQLTKKLKVNKHCEKLSMKFSTKTAFPNI